MKRLLALFATIMPLVFTSAARADLRDGLVGYWPFDGNLKDRSGHGNNLRESGSYVSPLTSVEFQLPSWTEDRMGVVSSAVEFNTGYTCLSIPKGLHVANTMTVSLWCKPKGSIASSYGQSLSYTDGNVMPRSQYVLYPTLVDDNSEKAGVGLLVGQDGVIVIEHAAGYCPFPLVWKGGLGADWTLVTITISKNGAPILYINGEYIKKGLASSRHKYITATYIGNGSVMNMAPCPFYGLMDDFRIYNRALSASEIKALYEEESVRFYTVKFNANDGTERIEEEEVIAGAKLTLPAILFCREDYVFQGWAKTASGAVEYEDGQEIEVLGDMTLYAVWSRPMTLQADSADWSSGSITLRCEDDATSASTHKYSLEYCNESGEWVAIDGAKNISATKGQDSAGQEVWIAKLTDPAFSSRLGGIPPVSYRVTDENGRVSDSIPTRRRYGLPVGVGQYENAEGRRLTELPDAPALAREFGRVARQRGGFACREALAGSSATCRALDDALDEMAAKVNPGDICLFYLNTHGGMKGTQGIFCMHDDDYFESRLVEKIKRFYEKGAAFVAVLGTCHSEALVQQSFPNVGIIAAAEAESVSDDFFDEFLIRYGWDRGWAGSGETVSFGTLAGYAKAQYESLYNGIVFVNEKSGKTTTRRASIDNEDLLARITAGKRGKHGISAVPNAILGTAATRGTSGNQVEVSWNADDRADGYLVFGGRGSSSACLGFRIAKRASCTFRLSKYPWLSDSSADRPAVFEVRAYNGAGIGLSDPVEGWIDADATTGLPLDWLQCHPGIAEASGGDVEVAAAMTAANGKMTVAECYALGIDPDNKDDNLSIEQFKMVDGKPVITLNHTADGSGKTFLPDVRVLGTTALGEFPQWDDVTDIAAPDAAGYRFFKATVELP